MNKDSGHHAFYPLPRANSLIKVQPTPCSMVYRYVHDLIKDFCKITHDLLHITKQCQVKKQYAVITVNQNNICKHNFPNQLRVMFKNSKYLNHKKFPKLREILL